jgi:hypothetical protein
MLYDPNKRKQGYNYTEWVKRGEGRRDGEKERERAREGDGE